MIKLVKLALLVLVGSLVYGLWLSLPKGVAGKTKEEIIDLKEDQEGKFGVD